MVAADILFGMTGVLGIGIGALPLYAGISFQQHYHRFLWVFCGSFAVTGAATLLHLFLAFPLSLVLALHTMFWTMLFTSFLAHILRKPVFIWGLLAVPLSLTAFFAFWNEFILEFGAIMGSVILTEASIFTVFAGDRDLRLATALTGIAAVFSAAYFYPTSLLGMWKGVLLVGGFTAAGLATTIFLSRPPQVSVTTEIHPPATLYAVFALFFGVFAAAFTTQLTGTVLVSGVLTLVSVTALLSTPRRRKQVGRFLTVVAVTSAVTWGVTVIGGVSLKQGTFTIRLSASLSQLFFIAAAQLAVFYIVEEEQYTGL